MADSILTSALRGRMSGAPIAVGGMALMDAKLEWIIPYIQDINHFTGLMLEPEMIQRWVGLIIMVVGIALPVISKLREGEQ